MIRISITHEAHRSWNAWALVADGRVLIANATSMRGALDEALKRIAERRARLDGLMEVPG